MQILTVKDNYIYLNNDEICIRFDSKDQASEFLHQYLERRESK